MEIIESRRLLPRSRLERGDSGGEETTGALAPQPAMENRFMMPESPVICGTRRGRIAAALAGPTVEGVAAALLSLDVTAFESVDALET